VWTAVGLVGLWDVELVGPWDVGLVMGGWKAGDGRLWADDGRLEGWRWSAVNPFPDSSCVKTSERWAGGWVGGGKSGGLTSTDLFQVKFFALGTPILSSPQRGMKDIFIARVHHEI